MLDLGLLATQMLNKTTLLHIKTLLRLHKKGVKCLTIQSIECRKQDCLSMRITKNPKKTYMKNNWIISSARTG
jgi:hypothetical protein